MKRSNFVKHLRKNDCYLHREGKNHSIFVSEGSQKVSAVPRHNELKNFTVRDICKQLGISFPKSFQ
ncbi:MAG: type II toxin-antitoxin system HicA family toxin [Candidatus Peregrinibacteria bacterium]|nr:type II toxin-antitoxin system HicA family toxin [Candidatus Peregrinibacteria bacterium]